MKHRQTLLQSLMTATLALLPAQVMAHPFELYGAGALAAGSGQAVTARADDWSALWYNPGGLGFGKPHMSAGFVIATEDVTLRYKDRPAGYDIPNLGGGTPEIPSEYRLQPRVNVTDLTNSYNFVLGAVGSLGLQNLRVGVAVSLPMTRLGKQVSHFRDEREQFVSNNLGFEFYGDRSQHQVILVGAAYRVLDWLSVGGGFSVMPAVDSLATVYLQDATNQKDVRISVANDQLGRTAPSMGIAARPLSWLKLGASYRLANYMELKLKNAIQIRGFQGSSSFPIIQVAKMALGYSPTQLALGASAEVADWNVAVDGVWSQWSRFVDTQGEDNSGFADVWSVRAGGEYVVNPARTIRLGLQWEPTPVPDQVGRSNFVDNDRLVASAGASHKFEVFKQNISLNWYVQLHHLLARDTNKKPAASYQTCAPGVTSLCDEIADTTVDPATGQPLSAYQGLQSGNPGFPGWASWGNLLSVGADLRMEF
jgi:long-subunit fatty acid transport protein